MVVATVGTVQLRVSRSTRGRVWGTDNNGPCLDTRDLMRQAASLASHMQTFGLVVLTVCALVNNDDGLDFLVSEYIAHDGTACDSRQRGAEKPPGVPRSSPASF